MKTQAVKFTVHESTNYQLIKNILEQNPSVDQVDTQDAHEAVIIHVNIKAPTDESLRDSVQYILGYGHGLIKMAESNEE